MTGSNRRPRVRLAVGADCLAATAGRECWTRPLASALTDEEGESELREALHEMDERLGAAGGSLRVTLLPPLVQVRRLELPRLREAERRRLLTRDSARYFMGAGDPQVVSAVPVGARHRSPEPIVAAAAPAALVERLERAAEDAGWSIKSILPAHVAWAAAAGRGTWFGSRRASGTVVVVGEIVSEVMQIDNGQLTMVRRSPTRTMLESNTLPSGLEDSAGPIAVLGVGAPAAAVADALTRSGHQVVSPGEGNAPVLAALFAPSSRDAELVPERVRRERDSRSRRLERRLYIGAAAMLLVASGIRMWDVRRELANVASARGSIRPQVAQALATREALSAIDSRLAVLSAVEAGSPRWPDVIATVAGTLPRDAHVTAFRGQGDSLLVEGVAKRAAAVFQSMQQAAGFAGVRADAPIRQEAGDGAPVEHFTLAARLDWTLDTIGQAAER